MMRWLRWNMAKLVTPGLAGELQVQAEAARMAPDRLAALQLAKLNRLLAHFRTVDFYARLLAEHGAPAGELKSLEQLKLLPVMPKEFIRDHGEQIAALPTAYRRRSTSGSTGRNLWFYQSKSMLLARRAAAMLAWSWVGVDWADPRFFLWSYYPARTWVGRLRFRAWMRMQNVVMEELYGITPEQAVRFLGKINRFKPAVIESEPTAFCYLVEHGLRHGIEPHQARLLLSTSEKLHDHQRRQMLDYFKAPIFERYGSNEFGVIGHQCLAGGPLHIPPTRLIGETDANGELLLTDLDDTASPFVRYQIGDLGSVEASRCPCGRTGQVIRAMSGRVQDVLITPSGRFLPGQLFGIISRAVPSIREFQIVQHTPTEFELRIKVAPDYREEYAEILRQGLRKIAGDEVRLQVVRVDEIPAAPPGCTAGKRRYVIREIP